MRTAVDLALLVCLLAIAGLIGGGQEAFRFVSANPDVMFWCRAAALAVLALIGAFLLILSVLLANADLDRRLGEQRGREEGARLRQKSVDYDDRHDALKQMVETTDQRRQLRDRLLMEDILPYLLIALAGFVGLVMVVGDSWMGGGP